VKAVAPKLQIETGQSRIYKRSHLFRRAPRAKSRDDLKDG